MEPDWIDTLTSMMAATPSRRIAFRALASVACAMLFDSWRLDNVHAAARVGRETNAADERRLAGKRANHPGAARRHRRRRQHSRARRAAPSQAAAFGQTFFVSTRGSDKNPGSESQPWRTLAKVTATLTAGQTAIFEDGVYPATSTIRFAHGGTADAPIVIRARNQHRATLRFKGLANKAKLRIDGVSFITVQDFDITQDRSGTASSDVLVQCWNGAHSCAIRGNRIHGAIGGFKTWNSDNVLLAENVITDTGIGASSFNTLNATFRDNQILGFREDGVQSKGGTRGIRIFNNHLQTGATSPDSGITLGGSSCGSTSTESCGNFDANGYEAYNGVAFNNTVVVEPQGRIALGLLIQGCDGCAAFNNVVLNAETGLATRSGPGRAKGWEWDVLVNNPAFLNNIIVGCRHSGQSLLGIAGAAQSDYNLYFDCEDPPQDAHSVYADPDFVDAARDWRLRPSSPATGRGTLATFAGWSDEPIDVSQTRDGRQRNVPWDMGVY